MKAPATPPIGLQLAAVAKTVSRAFDDALAAAGGSRPEWLLLLQLKIKGTASQRELADAVGLQGATVSHHLDALEAAGVVSRQRDPENRRTQVVRLTPAGEKSFLRLREAAMAFDAQLRTGLSEREVAALGASLEKLRRNVGG